MMRRMLQGWIALAVLSLLGLGNAWAADQKLSVDYHSARVEDVLRALTTQANMGLVTAAPMAGTVTLKLTDVTFDEALLYLSRATGLQCARHGNVVTVNPAGVQMRVFPLSFVNAAAARASVATLLSPQGTVDVFVGSTKEDNGNRTVSLSAANSLVVRDNESKLEEVAELLRQLDKHPRQVCVEARLVEVGLNNTEKLGFKWNLAARASGAAAPWTFPFDKKANGGNLLGTPPVSGGTGTGTGGGSGGSPPGEQFPYAPSGDFTFGKLSAADMSVAMEFLNSRAQTNLVSNPKIVTLENRQAEILVGTVVPIAIYQNSPLNGSLQLSGYEEKRVGIKLVVNPRVTSDGQILMGVHPEVSEILEYRGQFQERPVTSSREATADVMLKDGETLVIGGLVRENSNVTTTKVPFLGDIPVLGQLFRHRSTTKEKVDLMVFVTARLLPE